MDAVLHVKQFLTFVNGTQVFYDNDAGRALIRLAFCKRTEILDEAPRRLLRSATRRA